MGALAVLTLAGGLTSLFTCSLETTRDQEDRTNDSNGATEERVVEEFARDRDQIFADNRSAQGNGWWGAQRHADQAAARIGKTMLDVSPAYLSVLQMSAPKKWEMQDGTVADVHTPFTTRARELMELYNGLRMAGLSIDERLDVLLHVKWTVKEFDCNLTREIVSLIDREADLLNRGRSDKVLTGLRSRLATLFLHFIETPEFNPEAARFQKVPRELLQRPEIVPIPPRGGSAVLA